MGMTVGCCIFEKRAWVYIGVPTASSRKFGIEIRDALRASSCQPLMGAPRSSWVHRVVLINPHSQRTVNYLISRIAPCNTR